MTMTMTTGLGTHETQVLFSCQVSQSLASKKQKKL